MKNKTKFKKGPAHGRTVLLGPYQISCDVLYFLDINPRQLNMKAKYTYTFVQVEGCNLVLLCSTIKQLKVQIKWNVYGN